MKKPIYPLLVSMVVFGLWIATDSWTLSTTDVVQAQAQMTSTPTVRIEIGDQVVIRVPPDPPGQVLRLREYPSLDADTVINVADGALATVLDGPLYSMGNTSVRPQR